jgi:beta-lactam-binding protein with PASTA domain
MDEMRSLAAAAVLGVALLCPAAPAATPKVEVPYVIGQTRSHAITSLRSAGLRGESREQDSGAAANCQNKRGKVWKQTPKDGRLVPLGSKVTVLVCP